MRSRIVVAPAALAAVVAGVLAAGGLAGCGGGGSHRGARPSRSTTTAGSTTITAATRPRATGTLVVFKRVVSADPLASSLTIDRDGWSTATVNYGGPAGQMAYDFTLTPRQRRDLLALLHRTPLRDTPDWSDLRRYIYWLSWNGRTWRFEQKELPRSMHPLVSWLNIMLESHTHTMTGRPA